MTDQVKLNGFKIIGISVRTTNENNQAATDIPVLWQRFMEEGISAKIPNKISETIYCIYTDYEKDFTRPYTTILGCKVSSLEHIPDGMIAKEIDAAEYQIFTAKGDLQQGAVINEWMKIWQSGISRAYTSDFEKYEAKSFVPENAEVDIYISTQ